MLKLPPARTPTLQQAIAAVQLAQTGAVRRFVWHVLAEISGAPTKNCKRFLQECVATHHLRKTSTGNFTLTRKGKNALK